jgi:hypothetical protein
MFSVGEAFKQPVSGAEDGKSHLGSVDEGSEAFVVAFPGFTKEHGLNTASGTQRFFDKPSAFDADESAFGGKAAAESQPKLLQPAIVAAGKERGLTGGVSAARGFSRGGHHRGG